MSTKCKKCSGYVHPDEEGLCMKFLGMDTEDFYCINCFAAYLGSTPETLKAYIERFRDEGCQLFTPKTDK